MSSILTPILYSLVAGTFTGLGGIFALILGKLSNRSMSFLMGFGSGVMLMVAFNNLFLEAVSLISHFELIIMFSIGALTMMALDLILPHIELTARRNASNSRSLTQEELTDMDSRSDNDSEMLSRPFAASKTRNEDSSKVMSRGQLMAIGIILHYVPEGLIVTTGYAHDPALGLLIAFAMMLHNIPEGIVTAILLSESKMEKSKVSILTFLSGMAEPLGAVVGVILCGFSSAGNIVGFSLAFAAGIMTYIVADELIPVAHEYGYKHTVSTSLLIGIIFALLIDTLLS